MKKTGKVLVFEIIVLDSVGEIFFFVKRKLAIGGQGVTKQS